MEKRKSKIVGKKELLSRFPSLSQNIFDQADQLFPVRITRNWLARVKSMDDPLGKQSFPLSSEVESQTGDLFDPVGEEQLSPHPWLIQKHADRILFITTRRCHLYCRYCFRRNHTGSEDPSQEEWDSAIAYINDQHVQECILSGGDPLAISHARLSQLLETLQTPVIRIHTRAPITEPSVITPKLIDLLQRRSGVWFIVHCNHRDELSQDVRDGLRSLIQAGIPVLNQAVLLKGVNDSVDVLRELFQELVQLRVFPYYLHHTDSAAGNGAFRVTLERGLSIYQELSEIVSGIALPKYVIDPPDGSGKIDVATYVRNNHGKASRNP